AAVFQFVQTQMMRPAHQPKSSDPQQAMMNTMMNFMPLTVIFFGWNFAAGPVLYWAAQSVYSVIQQWFITGWGRMLEWLPWLPELPEHRRLGYRPPRDLDEVVVMSDQQPVFAPGPMGWLQRKMDEAQKQALERTGAQTATGSAASTEDAVEAEVVSATSSSKNGAPRARSKNARAKGKKGSGKSAAAAGAGAADRPNGGAPTIPSGAVIVPRKAKPAAEGTRSEVV
ncbi:MAG: inner rane protein oxaA, partial [Thermomicrobiales bacterium]|nr:inner rane protein oxaA [Thermomicrobiales bacterium]